MRAKKAGIPPEFMHLFGKKGFEYKSIEEKAQNLFSKGDINTSSIRQRVKFLMKLGDELTNQASS